MNKQNQYDPPTSFGLSIHLTGFWSIFIIPFYICSYFVMSDLIKKNIDYYHRKTSSFMYVNSSDNLYRYLLQTPINIKYTKHRNFPVQLLDDA